ncbi:MAG TPA: thymidine phosphorylase [Thermoanaerobaculia bacterium]|jgi:pyrimidine-nucleoside phosphorylase|nr:thymidine phosphorylase [Thermoanaerobaculia bacterium]
MALAYCILERKRAGMRLTAEEIRAVAQGAAGGSWSEGQLGAFLMAAAIQGLDAEETRALTLAMLESGERWDLGREVPGLCDKHSTGGVGDKVSLILAPLLASCGVPVAMLTGRSLGHTGGTMDKLESIPGMSLELDRARCLDLLARCGMAIGGATAEIAPADRRLYALRDTTATVDSTPLITASILSKKLATGAAAVVFDVKTGNGAFLPELDRSLELARGLVATAQSLGTPTSALVTDMSQPLGRWSGHTAEVMETFACLASEGPEDLMEVTFALGEEVARLAGQPVGRSQMAAALSSGRARERCEQWAALQGADPEWLRQPRFPLAPVEKPLLASRSGVLAAVDVRQLGLLLVEAGGGRTRPEDEIDFGISMECRARLGQEVREGDELARVYLRREDDRLAALFAGCFTVADEGQAPMLIAARVY